MKNIFGKISPLKILLSAVHSLFLVFITFALLYIDFPYSDDKLVISMTSLFEKFILNIDEKPERSGFLFVNTAYENDLIPKYDDDGFPIGNLSIPNRESLHRFISRLNNLGGSNKYILCNIPFYEPSPYDSVLFAEMSKSKRLIVPVEYSADDRKSVLPANIMTGYAIYPLYGGEYLKYRLMKKDTVRSIPLIMYEQLNKERMEKGFPVNSMGSVFAFNNVIIDYVIRKHDIDYKLTDAPYPFVNIRELMDLPGEVFEPMVKDRMILIGDFREKDNYPTTFGDMPGTLIMLNVFLTLENGKHVISLVWLILIFIFYAILSYYIFDVTEKEKLEERLSRHRVLKFLRKFIGFVFIVIVFSIFSYLVYNIHLNVFIIGLYLNLLDTMIIKYSNKKTVFEPESVK
ncbi:MAG: hypothetical protein AB9882_05950 [Ignavibacteriaceae bacterium]